MANIETSMNGTKMNASKDKATRANPFGSRFLTCVAAAVAVSIGSAGFAAAQPGSGSGSSHDHGGSNVSSAGPAGHGDSTIHTPGNGFGSAAGEDASGYHSSPSHPGYQHLDPGVPAPNNSLPAYPNGPWPGTPAAPQVVVPPPGAAFSQWVGDGSLIWNPGIQTPAPIIDQRQNGGSRCNPTRPECS
jgi:hypothetical protein